MYQWYHYNAAFLPCLGGATSLKLAYHYKYYLGQFCGPEINKFSLKAGIKTVHEVVTINDMITVTIDPTPSSSFVPSTRSKNENTKSGSKSNIIKPTSTTQPPPPAQPSEAVYIFFDWAVSSVITTNTSGGKFVMVPRLTSLDDKTIHDICNDEAVGSMGAGMRTSPDPPGLPPSFQASQDIYGKKGCKYISGYEMKSAGRFRCDKVLEFECITDPQENEHINCSKAETQEKFYVPRDLEHF
ncbi:hypothetical protein GCG54_00014373 [Colletotrichum gloeosporioides]|uniref:Uncharacterized protein n=1 Tax=Colletotrichum gloeosporioides TaxID=474922 RepID=A0A8H4C5I9_COLGL|nr:uncharacterized protein GCG54_00014373 [Colletotrichum gloeosporioides]KAF3797513.1 hypothetical protein GCG54_00014373 [Colletotrichum gloeosporioides]